MGTKKGVTGEILQVFNFWGFKNAQKTQVFNFWQAKNFFF